MIQLTALRSLTLIDDAMAANLASESDTTTTTDSLTTVLTADLATSQQGAIPTKFPCYHSISDRFSQLFMSCIPFTVQWDAMLFVRCPPAAQLPLSLPLPKDLSPELVLGCSTDTAHGMN